MRIAKVKNNSYAIKVYKKAVQAANRNRKPYAVKKAYSTEYNLPLKTITRTVGENTRVIAYNPKNGKPVQFSRFYKNGNVFYDNKTKHGFILDKKTNKIVEIPKFKNVEDFIGFWRNALAKLCE